MSDEYDQGAKDGQAWAVKTIGELKTQVLELERQLIDAMQTANRNAELAQEEQRAHAALLSMKFPELLRERDDRIAAYRVALEEKERLLKEYEWSFESIDGAQKSVWLCMFCQNRKVQGHKSTCEFLRVSSLQPSPELGAKIVEALERIVNNNDLIHSQHSGGELCLKLKDIAAQVLRSLREPSGG